MVEAHLNVIASSAMVSRLPMLRPTSWLTHGCGMFKNVNDLSMGPERTLVKEGGKPAALVQLKRIPGRNELRPADAHVRCNVVTESTLLVKYYGRETG